MKRLFIRFFIITVMMSYFSTEPMARKKAEVLSAELDRIITMYQVSPEDVNYERHVRPKLDELKKLNVPLAKEKARAFEEKIATIQRQSGIAPVVPSREGRPVLPPADMPPVLPQEERSELLTKTPPPVPSREGRPVLPPTDMPPALLQGEQQSGAIITQVQELRRSLQAYDALYKQIDPQDVASNFSLLEKIDLKNQFGQAQAILQEIALEGNSTQAQKEQYTREIQQILASIGKWQMVFATKALDLAEGRIRVEIQEQFDKKQSLETLGGHLKDIVDRIVFNFTKIDIVSLVQNAAELSKEMSAGETNLYNARGIYPAEFAAFQNSVDTLRRRLFLAWAVVFEVLDATPIGKESAREELFQRNAYDLGMTIAQSINAYDNGFSRYFKIKQFGSHPFSDARYYMTELNRAVLKSKIIAYQRSLKAYESQRDLSKIDLSKDLVALSEYKNELASQTEFSSQQIKMVNESLEMLAKEIAGWQIYFATQSLQMGIDYFAKEIQGAFDAKENMQTIPQKLNETVIYFALTLAYQKFISGNMLAGESVQKSNVAIENLTRFQASMSSEFASLTDKINTFAQRLYMLEILLFEDLKELGFSILAGNADLQKAALTTQLVPEIQDANEIALDTYLKTYDKFLDQKKIQQYAKGVEQAYQTLQEVQSRVREKTASQSSSSGQVPRLALDPTQQGQEERQTTTEVQPSGSQAKKAKEMTLYEELERKVEEQREKIEMQR